MRKKIDLHIHSHYSEDGDYSVGHIFQLAQSAGLSAISITDHDSIGGFADAYEAEKIYGVEFVPGVELTTVHDDGSQQHILGYYVKATESLQEVLNRISDFRWEVAKLRINKLREFGFALNEDNIWKKAGNRPPTATAIMIELFENPLNRSDERLKEYFEGNKSDNKLMHFYREYFAENGKAYVPFISISIDEGIDIIKKAGGIPILAHPKFVLNENELHSIVKKGIMGIEAISTYHTKEEIEYYTAFAQSYNLVITAGSDFHGPTSKPKVHIGGIEGNDYSLLQEVKKLLHNMT